MLFAHSWLRITTYTWRIRDNAFTFFFYNYALSWSSRMIPSMINYDFIANKRMLWRTVSNQNDPTHLFIQINSYSNLRYYRYNLNLHELDLFLKSPCLYLYINIYLYVYMYIYVCIYINIYIYGHCFI